MHLFTINACRCVILISLFTSTVQGRVADTSLLRDRPIDEYGNLCWDDEKARLDNFAIALHDVPQAVGMILIFDWEQSCYEEVVARAIQAKKYITEHRGIEWNRVVWRYGGRRPQMMFRLILIPPGAWGSIGYTPLNPSEAKAKNCKVKMYRRPKCYPY